MDTTERAVTFFPEIEEGQYSPRNQNYLLVMASGFEDRTLTVLQSLTPRPKMVLAIVYEGETHSNKDEEVRKHLDDEKISRKEVSFDRRNPQRFEQEFEMLLQFFSSFDEVVVDISAMSKLLIMTIIVNCKELSSDLTILYAEPRIYKPTFSEYQQKKRHRSLGAAKLFFQTSDVFATVTTSNLSSVSMDGSPIFLVAFPTFNEDLLITLFHQEFSPHACLIIHGMPLRKKDQWRMNAIKYVNRHVLEQIRDVDQLTIPTYDYRETFEVLESYYHKYKFTHKFVVGTTTSKFQAVAVSLFKLYRPDIQILYPTPKSYLLREHSSRAGKIHIIGFKQFKSFLDGLVEFRQKIDVHSISKSLANAE